MFIGNVRVVIENGTFSAEEAEYYIKKIQRHSKHLVLKAVTFRLGFNFLDLRYSFQDIPFERLRRIPLATHMQRRAVGS